MSPFSWVPELYAWHRGVTFLYPNSVLFRSGVTSLLPSPTASPSLTFIGHLLLARLSEKQFANINSKCSQFLYYPHFKDLETEARESETWLRAHSKRQSLISNPGNCSPEVARQHSIRYNTMGQVHTVFHFLSTFCLTPGSRSCWELNAGITFRQERSDFTIPYGYLIKAPSDSQQGKAGFGIWI